MTDDYGYLKCSVKTSALISSGRAARNEGSTPSGTSSSAMVSCDEDGPGSSLCLTRYKSLNGMPGENPGIGSCLKHASKLQPTCRVLFTLFLTGHAYKHSSVLYAD